MTTDAPGPTEPLRLLVVRDEPADAAAVVRLLREALEPGVEIMRRGSVAGARKLLLDRTVDCVVLDLPLAGAERWAALESILSAASEVPVVVLTESEELSVALHAVHKGAQDILIKRTAAPEHVGRSIRYAIERKHAEALLTRQALHDPLTALPNRVLLLDRLGVALARSRRRPTSLATLFLDLDGFKTVNDSLGHDAGDEVLVEVARRLRRALRPGDTVARFGGDEFLILCEDLRGEREAMRVAERSRGAIAEPFRVRGQVIALHASVGVACARQAQTSAQELIREADAAMYRAKRVGSGIELFGASVRADAISELEVEHQLRGTVERGELRVHYQPAVALSGDAGPSAIEALARWEHPNRGLLMPADFIPLAEEMGLAVSVDEWVLSEACRQLAAWREGRLVPAQLAIAVNLSLSSLRSPALADAVARELANSELPPSCLCLEIAESAVDRDPGRAAAALGELKRLGVLLALDHFGTGHSSLSALSTYPFDIVKFDHTLIELVASDTAAARMLGAVLGVVRAAGLKAVAEGIETAAQLEALRGLGYDGGQGYLFAAPAPADDIALWLAAASRPSPDQ